MILGKRITMPTKCWQVGTGTRDHGSGLYLCDPMSCAQFLAVPRQSNRWPCHSLTHSLTHGLLTIVVEKHYHRALWWHVSRVASLSECSMAVFFQHYRLSSIKGVQFRFANFASHFIRAQIFWIDFSYFINIQIFQIDFPLTLYLYKMNTSQSTL